MLLHQQKIISAEHDPVLLQDQLHFGADSGASLQLSCCPFLAVKLVACELLLAERLPFT